MPAKKSNVRKSTKKSGFKFRWWMGVGLVAVVALVGVLVLRFSQASAKIAYGAAQFAGLPNFATYGPNNDPATKPILVYDSSLGQKNIPVYAFTKHSQSINFDLQLFPGKYELCTYGRSVTGDENSFIIRIYAINGNYATSIINKLENVSFPKNGTYNNKICFVLDSAALPAVQADRLQYQLDYTGNGSAYVSGISIEAK